MFFSLLFSTTNAAFLQAGILRTILILSVFIFAMAWFREVRQRRTPTNLWFIEAWRAIRFSWALVIGAMCTASILASIWTMFLLANVIYFAVYLHF